MLKIYHNSCNYKNMGIIDSKILCILGYNLLICFCLQNIYVYAYLVVNKLILTRSVFGVREIWFLFWGGMTNWSFPVDFIKFFHVEFYKICPNIYTRIDRKLEIRHGIRYLFYYV
jgi:hypothetical protein